MDEAEESQIVREVLTIGRTMLAQAMLNLLIQRLINEMYAFGEYRMWVAFQRWRSEQDEAKHS